MGVLLYFITLDLYLPLENICLFGNENWINISFLLGDLTLSAIFLYLFVAPILEHYKASKKTWK